MKIEVGRIHVKGGRRGLDVDYVKKLAESIRELGLLNPITVDKDLCLIAGLHRLEAVKLLGLESVECMAVSLEGLHAEMAEIDENIIRNDLSAVEYGEILLRRKEIYEMLHPETKAGAAQAAGMNRALGNNVADKMSATSKAFVEDTAEKLGVDPRTVRRQIQTARNLTPEAKEIMRDADKKITKKAAMKISRLGPEQQREAATLLSAGEIKSVDEYAQTAAGRPGEAAAPEEEETRGKGKVEETVKEKKGRATQDGVKEEPIRKKPESLVKEKPEKEWPVKEEPEKEKPGKESPEKERPKESQIKERPAKGRPGEPMAVQEKPHRKRDACLREVVADLKNADKDCSGTPESFLAEYTAFVQKYSREIGWYDDPYYEAVFSSMDRGQLARLKEQTERICRAAEGLFHKVERMMEQ